VELRKLEDLFYIENIHLKEVLDKNKHGQWSDNKTRGYGIVICEYSGLNFGIPLRSNINHKHCFKTIENKGLDFTKAVLLTKEEYVSKNSFIIPAEEHTKIVDSAHHIKKKFSKYVEGYVKGVSKSDNNILKNYQYSTLQNYHKYLGI
jgi:protein AbiQ